MKKLLMLGFLILNYSAFASREGGNGGVGLLCLNDDGSKSAILFDLYEAAEAPLSLSINTTGQPLNTAVNEGSPIEIDNETQKVIDSIIVKSAIKKEFQEDLIYYVNKIKKQLVFAKKGKKLFNSEDLGDISHLTIPDECYPQNVATYATDELIRVNQELFLNLFTATDRAALIIHEVIYNMLRDYRGDKDSSFTRKLVAYLFASSMTVDQMNKLKEYVETIYDVFKSTNTVNVRIRLKPDSLTSDESPKLRLTFLTQSESKKKVNGKVEKTLEWVPVYFGGLAAACKVWVGEAKNGEVPKDEWRVLYDANVTADGKSIVDVDLGISEKELKQKDVGVWCATAALTSTLAYNKIEMVLLMPNGSSVPLSSSIQNNNPDALNKIFKLR